MKMEGTRHRLIKQDGVWKIEVKVSDDRLIVLDKNEAHQMWRMRSNLHIFSRDKVEKKVVKPVKKELKKLSTDEEKQLKNGEAFVFSADTDLGLKNERKN